MRQHVTAVSNNHLRVCTCVFGGRKNQQNQAFLVAELRGVIKLESWEVEVEGAERRTMTFLLVRPFAQFFQVSAKTMSVSLKTVDNP